MIYVVSDLMSPDMSWRVDTIELWSGIESGTYVGLDDSIGNTVELS